MENLGELHEDNKRGTYHPTIFIGCGGTGAKVLQRVRLQALERFGGFSQEELPGVAFISIDTAVSSKKAGAQDSQLDTTKTKTKQLCDFTPDERIDLDGSALRNMTSSEASLAQHPHIQRWFDSNLIKIASGNDTSIGAAQMRPLARVIAITNYESITNKIQRAILQVKKLDQKSERAKRVDANAKITFVVIASFAGGTGAGTFLEIAAMIRNLETEAKIEGRFVMPGVFRASGADSGPKLGANGYACLKELNHYMRNPYQAQWQATSPVQNISPLIDDVFIYDEANLTSRGATTPGDLYSTIGDSLFLPFFQGTFASDRRERFSNIGPVLLKHWENAPSLPHLSHKWKIQGETGGAANVDTISLDEFPRRFNSNGVARLGTPAWRLINLMSYELAGRVLDCLDSNDQLDDEETLRREFAQRLGFFQGNIFVDGRTEKKAMVVEALERYPSQGNEHAQIWGEISSRFADLTNPDQVNIFWDGRNCSKQLPAWWEEVAASFTGIHDNREPGVYVKRIRDNRRKLGAAVRAQLASVVEYFCEQPYMGPTRLVIVMERLAKAIQQEEVFWVKEMVKVADQYQARAAEHKNDWLRWANLASAADGNRLFIRRPGFEAQLKKAQDAAVDYWTAIAKELIHREAAELLEREISVALMEEVQKQKEMKQRLDSMRDEFKEFQKDYSQNTDSAIYEELPLAPDWIESSFSFYLGETPAIQHKTLYRVFERCKTDLGITTNRALRDRLLQSKAGFARDLRQCCWQALHGTDGVTRWFSEIGGKDSLLVRANFWDNLRQDCGSENSPKLKDYAKKLVERSMPWVTLDPRVQFDKIPFVVYLILPRAEPQNAEYKRAFEDAVSSLLRGISPLSDLYVGLGTESSEVTCYADIWALIPAAFKTLHNASGLAARFQACVAKSGAKDPDSFLHTDVDTVQFADLMVTSPQDAEGVFEAWKLFLLAIMLRVIMSSPNYSKPKRDEAQRLSPTFSFSYVSAGSKTQRQLGQYQAAVSTIQRDPHVRSQLQDMVNAQFIGQSASRYERLLGLARYYKQCIFPIRQPANGDRAVATPPYIALTNIEGECLTSWKNARLGGSPSIYETERELVARGPAQLLWSLRKYAGHTGGTDEGAALKLGMPATDDKGNFNYLEHPPKDGGYDEGDSVEIAISRLDKLKNQVFELLPPDLAQNGALREQNRYFPWLALGQWREVYLPSKHGQTPPDRNAPAAIRRQKTDEMTSAEIVEHFRNVPSDGATRSGGALIWMPDGNHSDWDYWYHNPALVALVTSARLTLPEYGATTPSTPAVPAAASVPAVPGVPAVPAAEPPLQYAVAGGQPETLVAADIAARVLANPSASHYVLVHNAWADAKTVPAVAARLAAPAAAAPPPPPGAPPPPAPPPPAALPPIPAGPFQYYDQARAAWVTIDGEELVKIVLALPVGHEGYIFVDGQNLLVQQHPELYRAIQTRRP